jgi:hypothetical protein
VFPGLSSPGSASYQNGNHAAALSASDEPPAAPASSPAAQSVPEQPASNPDFSAHPRTEQPDFTTPIEHADATLAIELADASPAPSLLTSAAPGVTGVAIAALSNGNVHQAPTLPLSEWGSYNNCRPEVAFAYFKEHGCVPERPPPPSEEDSDSSIWSVVGASPPAATELATAAGRGPEPAVEVAEPAAAQQGASLCTVPAPNDAPAANYAEAAAAACGEAVAAASVKAWAPEAVSGAALALTEHLPQDLEVEVPALEAVSADALTFTERQLQDLEGEGPAPESVTADALAFAERLLEELQASCT